MTRLFATSALATIMMTAATPFAVAQVLSGKVTDVSGEAPLQGAIVSIDGLNRSGTTDRFGEYRIANLPAGDYSVTVSYVGTENVSRDISVAATGAELDFAIGRDVRYLDNILVVGSAAAQASAINQQRASDSLISVIDSDGLGNFPDTTVADSLSRVPGLSIETDQGEGRYVSIRGLNTDLVGTSINGVRTPTPEDRRGILLDGIPSDLLDSIEVQKSLTPDLDADSLGGFINLKTLSAFDRDGQFFRVKAEGAYNEITEDISPKVTATYSNVFNDVFGVAVSLNYQSLEIEAHNNEAGEWGFDDASGAFFLNDDFETRWYALTRERLGVVANFDWRLNESTDLYVRALYNDYEDDEVRNKFEYKDLDDATTITAEGTVVPLNEIDAETRLRAETRQIQSYALGGTSNFDAWTLEYEVSYGYAEQDDTDNHDVTFRFEDIQDAFPGSTINIASAGETPTITGDQAFLDALYDPSNYQLDGYEEEEATNEDTEFGARFDVSKESLLGDTPVTWKAGLKLRDREKIREINNTLSETADGFTILASDFGPSGFFDGWRLNTPAPIFPDANGTAVLRDNGLGNLEVNQEDTDEANLAEDYIIEEQILAGYGMGTFDFGALTLVAGVRVEQTETDLQGNQFFVGDDASTVVTRNFTSDFTNVLPSVNAKYAFSDNLIGRAAYYAAVVRPNFEQMAPAAVLNGDRNELFLGNPNLDATEANNFDLSLEYYPTELSVISVGVFHKDIKDAIYGSVFSRGEDGEDANDNIIFTESFADFAGRIPVDLDFIPTALTDGLNDEGEDELGQIETFVNVDDVTLTGIEFNYVQSLDFLGDLWEGFLVSGNLTLTDSEATLPSGREVPLIEQSETIWNASIGYDNGPWDLRLAANYRGSYFDEIVGEEFDRFADDRLVIDLSAKYDVSDALQIYFEGKNVTDEPEYFYSGSDSRLLQYDEFGETWIFGVRYTY